MTSGFREFEFDLPEALLVSMVQAFDGMESASLSHTHLSSIPEAQGVYLLLHNDEIVYVGKTDAKAGLQRRLERHAWNVQHRRGLEAEQVFFKALRVFVFTAMDLESQLIAHYRHASSIRWNDSGFGSNDPGRNRDKTRAKIGGFDLSYPIDLDRKILLDAIGPIAVGDALNALRMVVPYIIRSEGVVGSTRKIHPDLSGTVVEIKQAETTPRQVIREIINALPSGWQATLLSGRVIIYKESETYPAGLIIAQT